MRQCFAILGLIGSLGCGGRTSIADATSSADDSLGELPTCSMGHALCNRSEDARCVNLESDYANCGVCGHACRTHETCDDGRCRPVAKRCSLGPVTVVARAKEVGGLAAGDLDGDGLVDFALINSNLGSVSIYRGYDGSIDLFYCQFWSLDELAHSDVDVADMDQDSNLDLIFANPEEGTYSVWYGAYFFNREQFLVGERPTALAIADFNADGYPDVAAGLVSAMQYTSTLSIRMQRPDGSGSQFSSSLGGKAEGVTAGDIDQDHQMDLVVTLPDLDRVVLLRGDGQGNVTEISRRVTGRFPNEVALADLNADSWLDLLVSNGLGESISVFLSLGAGRFSDRKDYACGSNPTSLRVVDVSGDGIPDVVTTSESDGTVNFLLGNGYGGFAPSQSAAVGDSPGRSLVEDFNGDGIPELIVATESADEVRHFEITCD